MKNESVISRIISAIFGSKIAVRENLYYDTTKGTLDFADDDLPNWRAVLAVVPGAGAQQIETPIIGGTSNNPVTIYYTILTPTGTGVTSSPDTIYVNEPAVNVTGTGVGAHFTVVTVGNVADSITQTNPGSGYNQGDTFTIGVLPGILFTIETATTMNNPTLIFRNADGSNYSGAANNVDTGDAIILTGDDDGIGHFADSFTFIIKP